MRWWLLIAALAGCGYESPIAPDVVLPPPVVLEPSPELPVPENRFPLQLYFTVGPSDPEEGQKAAFTATIVPAAPSYAWDFGDGQTETTEKHVTFHSYRRAGEYKPSVTVTVQGETLTKDRKIVVRKSLPPPPVFPPNPPEPPGPPKPPTPPPPAPSSGLTLALTCTPKPATTPTNCNVNASYNGQVLPANMIEDVHWIWGDDMEFHTAGPAASYAYPLAGTYHVFATADVHQPTTPPSRGEARANVEIVIPPDLEP